MRAKIKKQQIKKMAKLAIKNGFGDILDSFKISNYASFFDFLFFKRGRYKKGDGAALVKMLFELGPGFVEMARIAASRSDLVPFEFQNRLLNMSYDLSALSKVDPWAVLSREMGKSVLKDFSHIEKIPCRFHVAGTSHKAVLNDGRRVLITINNKKQLEKLKANRDEINWVFEKTAQYFSKARNLAWKSCFSEFESRCDYVSDLTFSCARMEIFAEHFKDSSKIEIPSPIWEYASKNVCVQTNKNLPEFSSVASGKLGEGVSKKYLARYVCESFVSQFFKLGYFFLRPQLSDWQVADKNTIVFTNFLKIGFIEQKDRDEFLLLLKSILKNDAKGAAKALLASHYQSCAFSECHLSGFSMSKIEGKTLSEKLWLSLDRAWSGGLIIPFSISQICESLLYLDHSVKKFDKEADIAIYLSSALGKIKTV